MEIVRSACPVYRFTMIPASRVALLSSIQVNDRGKAAPAVPYRRSELVRWPSAEITVPGRGFGPAGEGYLRMALTVDVSRIKEAVDCIAKLKK